MKKQRKKFTRRGKILIIFLLIILALFFKSKINSKDTENLDLESNENLGVEDTVQITEPESDTTITFTAIGDIMCHNTQYQDAYNSATGTYDFSYVFTDIKDYIQNSDIAVGNLETTFAGSTVGYSSYPTFNTPEILATNLKDMGIDVLSTANNHSLDKGYYGLESTISYLDEARNCTYWNIYF